MPRTKKLTRAEEIRINAAERSLLGKTAYVVYVPDCGEEIWDAEQVARYAGQVDVEAAYSNGVLV